MARTPAFDEAQHPREVGSGRFAAKPAAPADPAALAGLADQAAVGSFRLDAAGLSVSSYEDPTSTATVWQIVSPDGRLRCRRAASPSGPGRWTQVDVVDPDGETCWRLQQRDGSDGEGSDVWARGRLNPYRPPDARPEFTRVEQVTVPAGVQAAMRSLAAETRQRVPAAAGVCAECGAHFVEDPDGSPGVFVHDREDAAAFDLDADHPAVHEAPPAWAR